MTHEHAKAKAFEAYRDHVDHVAKECHCWGAGWDSRGEHERTKYARLLAAARAVVGAAGQRAVLQMDMEKVAALNEALAAAVEKIGGDGD